MRIEGLALTCPEFEGTSKGVFSPAAVPSSFRCTRQGRAPFRLPGQVIKNRTLENEGCGTQRMRQHCAAAGRRGRATVAVATFLCAKRAVIATAS